MPESGLLFTVKIIASVGSSINNGSSGAGARYAFDSGDGHQIARHYALGLVALQASERVQLGDARGRELSVQFADAYVGAPANRAVEHAADGDAAQKLAVVEVHHLNLQDAFGIAGRRGNRLDDRFEERQQIFRVIADFAVRHAVARVGVDHREVQLVFHGVEIDEEVVDFVEDFRRPRVDAVDLVQHDHRWELRRQRFLQDVARLGKRAFARIHEHHHAIDHAQRAFHLAAKITVAGRIDNIDLRVVEEERRILRENGDAAFALEVVRVHDALDEFLVRAKDSALAQHGVDKSRLAVVHVRDDGDIANVLAHDDVAVGWASRGYVW